jgi:hypothetical protein
LTSAGFIATVTRMDTMKLLLGATVALLLGALAVSWQGMKTGVQNAPADEIARLKKQVEDLQREQDKLQLERELQRVKSVSPTALPVQNATEIEEMKRKLEEQQRALSQIEADKTKTDKELEMMEEGEMEQRNLEKGDAELRRARLISEALLIAKVSNVDTLKDGGFITFDIVAPSDQVQVQVGATLAIRRKTGLLCQFKVSSIELQSGVADLIPGFGNPQPAVGDELIFPPQ